MIKDSIKYHKHKKEKGVPLLGVNHDYYEDLSETAKIPNVPSVYEKLFNHIEDIGLLTFQENYKILNNEEFIVV